MANVTLRGVGKVWDTATALEPTDLSIGDGEFVAVLGPSGCGKSTLLFMLAGIYTPSSGEILFDEQRVNEVETKDRNIGIVFQSYALYPNMSVLKNILYPLRFKKVAKADAEKRAKAAAALVHVDEFLDRKPSQLSGGQQQRVALARALVKSPQLLLLDEPLSNLDATLRLTMRSEIRRLQRQLGVTTVLVTHDQIEAITMADRIICMSRGRIEQIGTADELYQTPDSLFVARFIGSPPINVLTATIEGEAGDTLQVGEVLLPLQSASPQANLQADSSTHSQANASINRLSGELALAIRPENVSLTTATQGQWQATVIAIEPLGREHLLHVDSPLGTLTALRTGNIAHQLGDRVGISIKTTDWLLFDADGRRLTNCSLRN